MWPTHFIPNQPRVDGTPPPRFYLTTPPYPIENIEELQAAGIPWRMGFAPNFEGQVDLTSYGVPVGGTLTVYGFLTYYWMEELQANGVPLGGELKGDLVRFTASTELLQASGLPLSGELQFARVTYDNWPLGFDQEDLLGSGVPISGELL